METEEKREIVFWDCDHGAEILCHDSIEEAVRYWCEGFVNKEISETVTVYGYARMEPRWPDGEEILVNIVEIIDEEYGDPEGESQDFTDAMKEAADKLAEVIKRDYRVWSCEVIHTEEVNVADVLGE